MSKARKERKKQVSDPSIIVHLLRQLFITALVSLSFLALVSYTPDDVMRSAPHYYAVQNWIGWFGAYLSWSLILWFGFAAYPGIALILLASLLRFFPRCTRPVSLPYIIGILLFMSGSAMFMGVFPDFLAERTAAMNIANMPGGVIGQRFCSPWESGSEGWLIYITNSTGSAIISMTLSLSGLIIIWFFDWQPLMFRIGRFGLRYGLLFWKRTPPAPERTNLKSRVSVKEYQEKTPFLPGTLEEEIELRSKTQEKIKSSLFKLSNSTSYKLPSLQLLKASPKHGNNEVDRNEINSKKQILQATLESFHIDARVGQATCGPRVTLFEIKPSPGVKVERISSLSNNIAMNLKAESLRILTPIPGKASVGIEVPNSLSTPVPLRELLESSEWRNTHASIPIALGRNINGRAVIFDLSKAPHMLIAGATGSGKSVCMNALILSLLYRFSPDELKLVMIDPKIVEFEGYNTLPHLVTPVVTKSKKVSLALHWVVKQMEWRYQILSKAACRNIASYNARKMNGAPILDDNNNAIPAKLPYLVVIIDELADIMMIAKAEVETSLARIAQLARAVGIHTVIATQRPSVNIITGIIKANYPTRIAFQVSSVVDSRTILDSKGAEALLGQGDMLFNPPGGSRLERLQGTLVSDEEIENVVSFVSEQQSPDFDEEILKMTEIKDDPGMRSINPELSTLPSAAENEDEALIQQAIAVILKDKRATTSHLQRRLRIGYNRASVIIETLEERGIVGHANWREPSRNPDR